MSKCRKIINIVLVITGIAAPCVGEKISMAASQVQMEETKHPKESLELQRGKDSVRFELHEMMAHFVYSATGKKGKAKVTVLFEPRSGLYWWTISQKERFLKEYRPFLLKDRIVVFHFRDPKLFVEEQQGKAPTFDEAVKAVAVEIEKLLPKDAAGFINTGKEVNVTQILGIEFYLSNPPSARVRPAVLMDINRADSRWQVFLKGPNGDKATIILSEAYEIERAILAGKQIFPSSEK